MLRAIVMEVNRDYTVLQKATVGGGYAFRLVVGAINNSSLPQ